jgi:hypothetical protein
MSDLTDRLDEAMARAYATDLYDDATVWGRLTGKDRRYCLSIARTARRAMLAELDAMGWAVVPKEATGDMSMAAIDYDVNEPCKPRWADSWRVMLAAAPKLEEA